MIFVLGVNIFPLIKNQKKSSFMKNYNDKKWDFSQKWKEILKNDDFCSAYGYFYPNKNSEEIILMEKENDWKRRALPV